MRTIPISGRVPFVLRRVLCSVLLVAVSTSPLAACSSDDAGSGHPIVAVSMYPIEEIVRTLAGTDLDVLTLVPPGSEAHSYDPTPQQLTELERADLAVYLGGGFQPNVEKAIGSLGDRTTRLDLLNSVDLLPVTDPLAGTGTAGDAAHGDDHGTDDPHVWLDPRRMADMTAAVADAITRRWPDLTDAVNQRAGDYVRSLNTLDADMRSGLASCQRTVIVTTHRAFAYLADAYGLTQVAIAGISPSEEPSAQTLQALADFARAQGVTTIFFESTVPDDLATTLAAEIGASTAVLQTIESLNSEQLTDGTDYASEMRTNLAVLRAALGCT